MLRIIIWLFCQVANDMVVEQRRAESSGAQM